NPANAAPVVRVCWISAPPANSDLAEVIGKGGVALSRRARLLRDQLDQTRDQGQALWIVRGEVGIARLTVLGQVADHRDGASRLVFPLQAPGGDRCVVQGAVESEVHLH